jgi:hypothetical protein
MVRWLSLAVAAALQAASAEAALAQSEAGAKPAPSAQDSVIYDTLVCKSAPLGFEYTQRWLLDNEWTPTAPDLPKDQIVQDGEARFNHGQVTLSIVPHLEQRLSRCTSVATIAGTPTWSDLRPTFTATLGRDPESASADGAVWALPDHRIEARLEGNRLTVTFTPTGYSPFAITPAEARAALAPVMAPAPAADIAAAAVACVVAAGADHPIAAALAEQGWAAPSDRSMRFSRAGSNAAIFNLGSQCVVDAYGERPDAFDEIRDAIRDALVTRFGRGVRLPSSSGHAGDFSRGQGYLIGHRIGALSSEARANGLSIRFTVISI